MFLVTSLRHHVSAPGQAVRTHQSAVLPPALAFFFLGVAHSQPMAAVYHTSHKHQITDKSLVAAWPHPRHSLESETIRGDMGLAMVQA